MAILNDNEDAPLLTVHVGFPERGKAQVQVVVTVDGAITTTDAAAIRAAINAALQAARAARVAALKEALADYTRAERSEIAVEAAK